jgi:hypothetical protein
MGLYEGIWRKRQLLPSWILQFLCAGIFGIVSILTLVGASYLERHNQEGRLDDDAAGISGEDVIDYAQYVPLSTTMHNRAM